MMLLPDKKSLKSVPFLALQAKNKFSQQSEYKEIKELRIKN